MNTPSRLQPFSTNLSESYVRIGRALAGGHPETIAKSVLGNVEIRAVLVNKVVEMVDNECLALCRMPKDGEVLSPFRKLAFDQLKEFKWEMLISELQTKAPLLFKLLSKIVSHSDKRNQRKHGTVHHPAICMAVATILKERNKNMVGLQTLVSLLLFKFRVQKQVILFKHNTCCSLIILCMYM